MINIIDVLHDLWCQYNNIMESTVTLIMSNSLALLMGGLEKEVKSIHQRYY